MSKRVQMIGFTAAAMAAVTGLQREIMIDTTNWVPVVHDGVTAGGHPIALASLVNAQIATEAVAGTMSAADKIKLDNGPTLFSRGAVGAPAYSFTGDPTTGLYSSAASKLDFAIAGADVVQIGATYIAVDPGNNPAGSGAIRLKNNVALNARNVGNTADIAVVASDAANIVYLGDDANAANVKIRSLGTITMRIGGNDILSISAASGALLNTIGTDLSWLRGFIHGFSGSAPGGAQVLTLSPGACVDSTNAFFIKNGTTWTKTFAAWAAGTGNGGLDTGAIAASTEYWVHKIYNPTTGADDVLLSLSFGAPTLPVGFTKFRVVSWLKTDATPNIRLFTQLGERWIFQNVNLDANVVVVGTTQVLVTLAICPTGIQVDVNLRGAAANVAVNTALVIPDWDEGNVSPVSNDAVTDFLTQVTNQQILGTFFRRTNTSRQVGVRSSAASSSISLASHGFYWDRGRNA